MRNGFLRVAACAPHVKVADVDYNISRIIEKLDYMIGQKVELAVFPEMSITGYTCADLFHNFTLMNSAADALARLVGYSRENSTIDFAVGLPVSVDGAMYNCAALIQHGEVSLVAKSYIPNYNEFYERRWWRPLPFPTDRTVMVGATPYNILLPA